MPLVTVTNLFPEAALAKLAPHAELRTNQSETPPSREDLLKAAAKSQALITYLSDPIDRDVIARARDLKIIANYGAGYNNIDVHEAARRGIWVTNTPGVLHETTADLTWAMMLAVARRIAPADAYTRAGRFKGWSANMFLGSDVYGKTLGVIGCGEIGRAVARRAAGFRMRVLYHQRHRLPGETERELGLEYVSLDELLRNSDYVSLHVPLTEATRHLVGERELALMKPSAFLIHAGRGKVVDDAALIAAIKARRLSGAALDVYEDEPKLSEGMEEMEELLLLPHIGSASTETRDRMALLAADNVLDALAGKTPRSLVPGWGG